MAPRPVTVAPLMAEKSKKAAAAAAEPPSKKSKNAGAALRGVAEVAGGEAVVI